MAVKEPDVGLPEHTATLPTAQVQPQPGDAGASAGDTAARVRPLVHAYVNNIGQVVYGHQPLT